MTPRPRPKTAKLLQVGRTAVDGHDDRVTVSTLAEARYFAGGGFRDSQACITAAAYDKYDVVDSDIDGGRSVVEVSDRINGW